MHLHMIQLQLKKIRVYFNNDMMKIRLCQLTIPNIENKIYFLEDKYWRDIDFSDPDRTKHPDDKKLLEIYVNVHNNTNDNMDVTTEHAKVFENGVELKDKFDHKFPLLIVQLRPNEVFSCKCVAVLGVGFMNNIWAASGNTYYEQIDENKFKFVIESQSQMDEYEILIKSCKALKDKIKIIKDNIMNIYDKPEIVKGTALKMIFEHEDHTIGNILNDCLQNNKTVLYSGLSKPNLLLDTVIIKFTTAKPNPLKPVYESLDHITKLFDKIQNKLKPLS